MAEKSILQPGDALSKRGHRRTEGRLSLVRALNRATKPLSVSEVMERVPALNMVTVYRALSALERSGLLRRVDVGHAHAHYELVRTNDPHHHLICRTCGTIEDIPLDDGDALERSALQRSKKFGRIDYHTAEIFGSCLSCINNS